ncbi:alpha-N-arabinofuranosidase [Truepera radiovictrix]|uniref:non-reducing end alpha-L-arabinofuranosidase n=1 Tax=Truepera radiovictrix (strain DSM 17093 / CIP 108686 / LMG 22925 / RQ-24) TaxID=649638 RepID=D7CXU3_TRURR|nr:alpha-L-arabinofuranosidase C-terminal domain-containing protein [Truepera radiovictrix]ADI13303.1 alpha-L-arabinofuranosidase domain protein [Truepera radiovictrix DSM 17093]WMT58133.1 alpha-L-arabinofuranosidase C-terminal domain-containing protein [Truepera radiovictrix]
MSNTIAIDPLRTLGRLERNVFGGFAEHLGRCIYGGLYDPNSPHADASGLRTDVLDALKRLNMPVMRYPGGNFVSGYRWRDGVGPKAERPARTELAWHDVEPNTFGTNEFVDFCRRLGTEPYLVVNAGDGDMREARDWLEYCNGTQDTALVKLRRAHGYEAPHGVRYWGIGNEVDGPWQIGYKTPEEYARTYTEFAKVMKWTDPSVKLVASGISAWDASAVERVKLLMEHAAAHIDYLAIHWYVGNDAQRGYRDDDFASYMALSERIEDMLVATEGVLRAMSRALRLGREVAIAVDEWNVWYRTGNEEKLEEVYNLEDALMTGIQLNALIRHARSVKMANLAQVVNVIAPILTRPDGLVLQSIFYPFELYSRFARGVALDVYWAGDTFSTPEHTGLRVLDVAATLDESAKELAVFVVNRSLEAREATLSLGTRASGAKAFVVNGPDIKATNTFEAPDRVGVRETGLEVDGDTLTYTFEPHSVTVLSVALEP